MYASAAVNLGQARLDAVSEIRNDSAPTDDAEAGSTDPAAARDVPGVEGNSRLTSATGMVLLGE